MHHVDFLNDDLVDIPKTRSGDFVAFMDDLFQRYIRHVQSVDQTLFWGASLRHGSAPFKVLATH
ncbi:MAG: hypothetical protein KDB01_02055 [Planctomycetaceae bacterium]|nr:hypothetical protein [Planctomycetaceae bacterium]